MENAAEAIRNTGSYSAYRGYVPQHTGQQPVQAQRPPYAAPPAAQQPFQDPRYQGSLGSGTRGFTPQTGRQTPVRTAPRKRKKAGWIFLLIGILLTIAVVIVPLTLFVWIPAQKQAEQDRIISDTVTPYNDLYCPGVWVDGISLGGMTPDQAMNSVKSQINQRYDAWKVKLIYNGSVLADISADTLEMSLDENELINLMNDAWRQGHTGTMKERYDQMEALKTEPYSVYTAKPSGNTGKIDQLLTQIKNYIERDARDATVTFDPTQPDSPFVFTSEVVGLKLDTEPLKKTLYEMVSKMKGGTLEITPEEIQPSVAVEDLEPHYKLRATARTPIDDHSPDERNNNIRRAFQPINGYELKPGKTFSFNKIVGERSLENGFYPAVEYAYDEHVMGVGGGVCQASTTVYQAAVCAGLQILSRKPHSDSVSYTEYGKDATVYWYPGGKKIDLTFKNNTEGSVYFIARVISDPSNKKRLIAEVSIYGEDLENISYDLDAVEVETLPALLDPVYVSDKSQAAKARDGHVVKSYRLKYVDGNLVERKELYTDTYKPKAEKIYDPSKAKE